MWRAWILSICAAAITSVGGATAASAGDRTPATQAADAEPTTDDGRVVQVLRWNLCVGDPPAGTRCDLKVPRLREVIASATATATATADADATRERDAPS
ncbi:MAG: hypothetical protein H6710_24465 [Myxococcales bacterium]|nr:hypothetical protein [Myxococcales bacterium]MCB9703258.1 hypothetical protein [Myxococcales bacterium]